MSKKHQSQKKFALDIPPVPAATRYVFAQESQQPAHLLPWVGDLLGIDYEEITLEREAQSKAQLFVQRSSKVAVYLFDALFVPESKRLSHSSLSEIEGDIYLTIHMAIASPETIKSTTILLQENPPQTESDYQAAQLLNRFINLQFPRAILESFQYEKVITKETLSASPWGAALFSSLAAELPPHQQTFDENQDRIKTLGAASGASKQASLFFISLFASQELRESFPQLAQYSAAIIPAGLNVAAEHRSAWAQAVVHEWSELWERELAIPSLVDIRDRDTIARWLEETIQAYENQALAS